MTKQPHEDLVERAKEYYLKHIVFDPGKSNVESNSLVLARFAEEVRDEALEKYRKARGK